jgi:hypothetical protein
MQIGPAGSALCLPSDKKIIGDFFSTYVANVHEMKIQVVFGNCQEAFLYMILLS